MKFGDYLRQKREDRGWTQPEAAAKARIEQSYLSKLETGRSYPSDDVFERLVEEVAEATAEAENRDQAGGAKTGPCRRQTGARCQRRLVRELRQLQ